ncbi:MAG: hypothetical protein JO041_00380 [Acidobacteria bacterium]|nr:hypothetical protein [Acidobacteriota bacterium]
MANFVLDHKDEVDAELVSFVDTGETDDPGRAAKGCAELLKLPLPPDVREVVEAMEVRLRACDEFAVLEW